MQATQKKSKGIKRVKGVPVHENELKSPHKICLTDTTWEKMKAIAKSRGMSVGQLVEATFKDR